MFGSGMYTLKDKEAGWDDDDDDDDDDCAGGLSQ